MALELYQEIIPFSNEKARYPVSSNGSLSNPIVMPLSFDVTSTLNTVETVFYIRNNSIDKYYTNVLITLMAPKTDFADYENLSSVSFDIDHIKVMSNPASGGSNVITNFYTSDNDLKFTLDTDYTYEIVSLPVSGAFIDPTTWSNSLSNDDLPISGITNFTLDQVNSNISNARFSFGYDEVSELEWGNKRHSILIPTIGNSINPDNSFIPIRLRIWINGYRSSYTLRDYFINISYESEVGIA